MSETLSFVYTNWRGETAVRHVQPIRLEFGSTDWHPEPQWLLVAVDTEKSTERSFAVKDIQFVEGKRTALYPDQLDGNLRAALSTMLWNSGRLARMLREDGEVIKTRAEDEQAHVLHWLIHLVLAHGDNWLNIANERMRAVIAARSTKEGE